MARSVKPEPSPYYSGADVIAPVLLLIHRAMIYTRIATHHASPSGEVQSEHPSSSFVICARHGVVIVTKLCHCHVYDSEQ